MARAGLYCAMCGKPLEPGRSIGSLCIDCFLRSQKLLCVPERLEFDYCKYCGSLRFGHRWLAGGELEEASLTYLSETMRRVKPCISGVIEYGVESITPLTTPSWRTVYLVRMWARVNGVDDVLVQDYRVEVYARPTICPACKDVRGGDYNVLLQIRGAKPEVIAGKLEDLFNNSSQVVGSIVDIVEQSNGVDFLLLDRGSASKIVRELRKWFKLHVKITGEDVGVTSRGRLRRRVVYSVLLQSPRRRK